MSEEERLTLRKPGKRDYKAVMLADRDFMSAGEEAYCGMASYVGYLTWLRIIRRQSDPEYLYFGGNCNEIYLLLNGKEEICGFGQFRPFDTKDVITWAGHIGYSVPPSKRGNHYAHILLMKLLDMAFDRGLRSVLLTCDRTNLISKHVIENCGGRFTGTYTAEGYDKLVYTFYPPRDAVTGTGKLVRK